jgi:RND family efflux transporter MFP subunit
LAPVPVTVTRVDKQSISPELFGIGIVEARYSYRIGPVITGHVLRLDNHVGDRVSAGQVLGEMDSVDMDNRIAARDAAIKRAKAAIVVSQARVTDSMAREQYAKLQASRYEQLLLKHIVSEETAQAMYKEYEVAQANLAATRADLNAAREELAMLKADRNGLVQQRDNLRLVSPVDGLVVGRYAEPGSTVVAGQVVLEVIDPSSIWVNVRFDQLRSGGLETGLPATITLRSRFGQLLKGYVARVEPLADAVTEEIMAKVNFNQPLEIFPAIGELAEVSVALPPLDATPVVPNAGIKRLNGETGVWRIKDDSLQYTRVLTGASNLDGRVQILQGLQAGDTVVVYSNEELTARSRISIVDRLVEDKT